VTIYVFTLQNYNFLYKWTIKNVSHAFVFVFSACFSYYTDVSARKWTKIEKDEPEGAPVRLLVCFYVVLLIKTAEIVQMM